jgi:hypothetical protein
LRSIRFGFGTLAALAAEYLWRFHNS